MSVITENLSQAELIKINEALWFRLGARKGKYQILHARISYVFGKIYTPNPKPINIHL